MFKQGDRVKCLASHFDDGTDAQGRTYSANYERENGTPWVVGTVMRVLSRSRGYRVKYDDDGKQYTTKPAHLEPWSGDEATDSDSESADESVDLDAVNPTPEATENPPSPPASPASEMDWNPESGMDDADPEEQVEDGHASEAEGGGALPIGGETEAHGNTWTRVVAMGEDARGDRAKFEMEMRKMCVNSHTKRSDIWKELLPVDLDGMLKVVKENATRHSDRTRYDAEGLLCFLCCLYGGCQFVDGTGLWATEKCGMMPPPDFGEFLSRDKFKRWLRYLSEGLVDADP